MMSTPGFRASNNLTGKIGFIKIGNNKGEDTEIVYIGDYSYTGIDSFKFRYIQLGYKE